MRRCTGGSRIPRPGRDLLADPLVHRLFSPGQRGRTPGDRAHQRRRRALTDRPEAPGRIHPRGNVQFEGSGAVLRPGPGPRRPHGDRAHPHRPPHRGPPGQHPVQAEPDRPASRGDPPGQRPVGRGDRTPGPPESTREITLLMATDDIRADRLRVEEEVQNGLFYCTTTIWETIPKIFADVREAFETYYDKSPDLPPFLRYRTWIGGDRDGNPLVTVDVTRKALAVYRKRRPRKIPGGAAGALAADERLGPEGGVSPVRGRKPRNRGGNRPPRPAAPPPLPARTPAAQAQLHDREDRPGHRRPSDTGIQRPQFRRRPLLPAGYPLGRGARTGRPGRPPERPHHPRAGVRVSLHRPGHPAAQPDP